MTSKNDNTMINKQFIIKVTDAEIKGRPIKDHAHIRFLSAVDSEPGPPSHVVDGLITMPHDLTDQFLKGINQDVIEIRDERERAND